MMKDVIWNLFRLIRDIDYKKVTLILKDKLQNDYIKFTTKLQQIKKTNVPYTNKEKFNKMKEDNPNLEKLRKALGLDPDY